MISRNKQSNQNWVYSSESSDTFHVHHIKFKRKKRTETMLDVKVSQKIAFTECQFYSQETSRTQDFQSNTSELPGALSGPRTPCRKSASSRRGRATSLPSMSRLRKLHCRLATPLSVTIIPYALLTAIQCENVIHVSLAVCAVGKH